MSFMHLNQIIIKEKMEFYRDEYDFYDYHEKSGGRISRLRF